jgi:uncharacterized membrane protein
MERLALREKGVSAEKAAKNVKVVFCVSLIVAPAIFIPIQVWILYLAYTGAHTIYVSAFGIGRIMAVGLGLTWLVIGYVLPKSKQNTMVGLRTEWTLSCETTWNKTHKLAGMVMTVYGIISIIISLFVFEGFIAVWVSLGGFIIITIPLIIYSYIIYKQEREKERERGIMRRSIFIIGWNRLATSHNRTVYAAPLCGLGCATFQRFKLCNSPNCFL